MPVRLWAGDLTHIILFNPHRLHSIAFIFTDVETGPQRGKVAGRWSSKTGTLTFCPKVRCSRHPSTWPSVMQMPVWFPQLDWKLSEGKGCLLLAAPTSNAEPSCVAGGASGALKKGRGLFRPCLSVLPTVVSEAWLLPWPPYLSQLGPLFSPQS